jgi:hypothetical protein
MIYAAGERQSAAAPGQKLQETTKAATGVGCHGWLGFVSVMQM